MTEWIWTKKNPTDFSFEGGASLEGSSKHFLFSIISYFSLQINMSFSLRMQKDLILKDELSD